MRRHARPVLVAIVAFLALGAGTCAERAEPRNQREIAGATTAQMVDHFDEALAIRDALIEGDLEAARRRARALVERRPADLPAQADRYAADFRVAAQAVIEAPDRGTAGRAVGRLAASCGACHQGLSVGVDLAPPAPPPTDPSTAGHMLRHLWAADRLWEGLVVPSDEAWARGAAALADAALRPETLSPDLPLYPKIEALALRVHSLGDEGKTAVDTGYRIDIYAGLLATCARCHGLLAE